jgi:hypothetical protein
MYDASLAHGVTATARSRFIPALVIKGRDVTLGHESRELRVDRARQVLAGSSSRKELRYAA